MVVENDSKARTQLVLLTPKEAELIKFLREIYTGEVKIVIRCGEPVRTLESVRSREL